MLTPFYTLPADKNTWRWWRGPLTVALLLLLFELLLVLLNMLPLILNWSADQAVKFQSARSIVVNFVGIAVMLPIALLVGRAMLHLKGSEPFSALGRFRWPLLFQALGLSLLALLPLLISGHSAKGWQIQIEQYAPLLLTAVFILPVQCAAEEVVFRGLITQSLVSWWGRNRWAVLAAVLVSAAVFTVVHGLQNPALLTQRFGMALILSWLTWRTHGLEAAIGMHIANNALGVLLGILTASLLETVSTSQTAWFSTAAQVLLSALAAYVVTTRYDARALRESRLTSAQRQ